MRATMEVQLQETTRETPHASLLLIACGMFSLIVEKKVGAAASALQSRRCLQLNGSGAPYGGICHQPTAI